MRVALALLATTTILAASSDARACKTVVSRPFEVDRKATIEGPPPERPRVELGSRIATCRHGVVKLELVESLEGPVGYYVRFLDGDRPSIPLPTEPLVAVGGGFISIDASEWEGEPLEFRVTLTAVDKAGRESPPSEPISVIAAGQTPDPAMVVMGICVNLLLGAFGLAIARNARRRQANRGAPQPA